MKPILFSLAAVFLFAFNAALAERFLKGNHPLWTLLAANALIPVFSLFVIHGLKTAGYDVSVKTPFWTFAIVATICNVAMFFGNFSFYAAYESGGTPTQVTTILCLLPIITTAISLLLGGKAPTTNEVIGTIIVLVGIFWFFKK